MNRQQFDKLPRRLSRPRRPYLFREPSRHRWPVVARSSPVDKVLRMASAYHPFPNTHWSLVQRAGEADESARREAFVTLLKRYQPALRSYLRVVRQYRSDVADDLVQSFITDKLIEQQLLQHADQKRGRFRSFLLTSLNNFVLSRYRAEAARPVDTMHSVPDEKDASSPAPAAFIEAEWARALVRNVLELMRAECRQTGRLDVWTVFEKRVLAEIFQGEQPLSYEALADELSLKTPTQAANLLVTGKRMYARLLRAAIAEYERQEGAIDQEIDDLREALAAAPPADGATTDDLPH